MAPNRNSDAHLEWERQEAARDATTEAAMMAMAEILLEIASANSNPSAEEEIATKKRKGQAKDD